MRVLFSLKRLSAYRGKGSGYKRKGRKGWMELEGTEEEGWKGKGCLLYTSDAADE